MIAVPLLLGVLAALAQTAVIPALYLDPWAAPVLAAAFIGGWSVVRRPEETWAIGLPAALLLGVVSSERAGWFLLALLPAIGASMVLDTVSPSRRGLAARLARAGAAAALGAFGYVTMLAVSAASGAALSEEARALSLAVAGTVVVALGLVLVAAPFHRRPASLFS